MFLVAMKPMCCVCVLCVVCVRVLCVRVGARGVWGCVCLGMALVTAKKPFLTLILV